MRRDGLRARIRGSVAIETVSIALVVGACGQSASARQEKAAARAGVQADVRQTETVKRVTIPRDSGRILYDAPTDLSLANATRTKARIVGIDSSTQPLEPAQHGGAPARNGRP